VLEFEVRKNKPSELRLYNLRKFFKKFASQAGSDFVSFWFGHTSSLGVDLHYITRDLEHHRRLYATKAMPHLGIETPIHIETDKAISTLEQENKELKEKIHDLETKMETMYQRVFPKEIEQDRIDKMIEDHTNHLEHCTYEVDELKQSRRKEEKYLTETPEERKKREQEEISWIQEYVRSMDEHSEDLEQQMKRDNEEKIRSDERRKMLEELEEFKGLLRKSRKNKE
jgi:hypothetical protein